MAGKILIVDDISTNRILLKVKLTAACYQTIQASTGAGAIEAARTERPDLALIDISLPDIDGLEVCRRLRADPLTSHIPLIVVTADGTDSTRIDALRSGASDVYRKPVEDVVLLARIRGLLRAREAAEELGMRDMTYREFGFAEAASEFDLPARIAVVAWHGETAFRWIRVLQSQLPDRVRMVVAEEALHEWPADSVPDLFLICTDPARPGDSLRLMSELRSRHATRFSAICIALPRDARDTAAMALDLGAGDLIEDGANPTEIAHRIRAQIDRKRQTDRLRASVATGLKMALTDPLTGLYNRRYALPHLARIADHSRGTGRSFAVMVMDLDRFKVINDTYGHAGGDAVLVEVAERFRTNLRAVDLVARIGGEEFLVALPDTGLAAARSTAERLRRVIEERGVRLPAGGTAKVTMSIGLAMCEIGLEGPGSVEALIARADDALFAAKTEGRNQVTVARSAA